MSSRGPDREDSLRSRSRRESGEQESRELRMSKAPRRDRRPSFRSSVHSCLARCVRIICATSRRSSWVAPGPRNGASESPDLGLLRDAQGATGSLPAGERARSEIRPALTGQMALLHLFDVVQPVATMTGNPEAFSGPRGTVHLAASHAGRFQLANGLVALENLEWLGEPVGAGSEHGGWRRVNSVLALPVNDGSSPGPIRKGALVDIGPVERSDDAIRVGIGWQSDSITPLFPVFAGRLTIRPGGLFLDGDYAPPLGRLGLLIDARLLHFVAGRTAQTFLARIAGRLEA